MRIIIAIKAYLKILHHVQTLGINLIPLAFDIVDDRSQIPDVAIIEVPLIVGVILENFESLANALMNTD